MDIVKLIDRTIHCWNSLKRKAIRLVFWCQVEVVAISQERSRRYFVIFLLNIFFTTLRFIHEFVKLCFDIIILERFFFLPPKMELIRILFKSGCLRLKLSFSMQQRLSYMHQATILYFTTFKHAVHKLHIALDYSTFFGDNQRSFLLLDVH